MIASYTWKPASVLLRIDVLRGRRKDIPVFTFRCFIRPALALLVLFLFLFSASEVRAQSVLSGQVSAGTIICTGGTTSITFTATGGDAPYVYSIDGSNFQANPVFNSIQAGTYAQLRIRDAALQEISLPALQISDGTIAVQTVWQDFDGDGFGDPSMPLTICVVIPAGYSAVGGDCNDQDLSIKPGATETCNQVDDNCDGITDNTPALFTYYPDVDGDGFGTGSGVVLCYDPGYGYTPSGGDCDDGNDQINPQAPELCNDVDDNCNNLVDDGLVFSTYYIDEDFDSFGSAQTVSLCYDPGTGYATVNSDCDDGDPSVNPSASEICDGIDNDCDGSLDINDLSYEDNDPPMALCRDVTLYLNSSGVAVLSASELDNSSPDNCGVAGISVDMDTFNCSGLGENVVTLTVTDLKGNSSTCTSVVTVLDTIRPSIITPLPVSVNADYGVCTYASSQLTAPSATDNCNVANVLRSPATLQPGLNTVTWSVSDNSGNTRTVTQQVTVLDNQNPTVTSPAPLSVYADQGVGTYASNQLPVPSAQDNCSVASGVASPASLVLGANTVTWTVTDGSGNQSIATQVVTVLDNQPPIIATPLPFSVSADSGGCTYASSQLPIPSLTDNSGSYVLTRSPSTLVLGTNIVTWTVTDASGNTASTTQTVTVNDVSAPLTPVLPDLTLLWCTATPPIPSTTDICTGTVNGTTSTSFPLTSPGTTVITWTFTDGNGNSTTATQQITVLGPPVAGTISGPVSECVSAVSGTATYSVASVPFVTTYVWTVPTGMVITSGQGTRSINVSWTAVAASLGIVGNVCVTPFNNCGAGTQRCQLIGLTPVAPVVPGSISGSSRVCPGDIVTYSVSPVARAVSYTWGLPSGMTILSGAGTNVVNVSVGSSYTGGTLSVTAVNACNAGASRTKSLALLMPLTPGIISGSSSGLCGLTAVTFTTSGSTNASSYVWTVPAGVTITGGQGTTSMTADFSFFTGTGAVTVKGVNACGESLTRSFSVAAAPLRPSFTGGTQSACVGLIYTYSIATVPNAISYTWIIPSGATLVSGQGTKIINVIFNSAASNRIINVWANNSCGQGPTASYTGINITACTAPRLTENTMWHDVRLYPNPASDRTVIAYLSEHSGSYQLRVSDVTGRTVMEERKNCVTGSNTTEIDLTGLAKGLYIVRLKSEYTELSLQLMVN